jgi:hypothetical protein
MLADKDKSTSVNGLNQMFRITKNSGNRTGIVKIKVQIDSLNIDNDSVLTKIDVSLLVNRISSGDERIIEEYDFENAIQLFAKAYEDDRFFDYDLKFNACKKCEFKKDENKPNLKSGFEGMIPKGTPIIQILPFKTENWQAKENKNIEEKLKKHDIVRNRTMLDWYKKSHWVKKEYN